jgi:4-diphosphocytidyl-2-C-methyl-D-erythritol kinase
MEKTIKAYAKINLYLSVGDKRKDGYHEIETLMQEISLFDNITLKLAENGTTENTIKITSDTPQIPLDENNIAYKCADKFLGFIGKSGLDVKIHIEKHIPISGGLAGGSTDGAAVLKLLNEMTDTFLDLETLRMVGAKVGADIPFCLTGGCAVCRGIGEKVTSLSPAKPNYRILIVPTDKGVSTPIAYSLLDEAKPQPPCSCGDIISDVTKGRIPHILYNAFESVILPIRPAANDIKNKLTLLNADGVMMSGSGPTIFALFYDENNLLYAKTQLADSGITSYICDLLI